MYHIQETELNWRDTPWDIPHEVRSEKIKHAKKIGQRTVVYLYPAFDSSTFRYRGFNVVETLDYSFFWSGAYFQYNERSVLLDILPYIDIIVFIRCPWDNKMDDFIKKARTYHIPLVYDVDDLIYSSKYMPEVVHALGLEQEQELNFWFGLTNRNQMIAMCCDAFITTNEFLAKFLEEDFHKPVFVMNNYLNWYQEKVSEEYFTEKYFRRKPEENFKIGYFSGSPTHNRDLLVLMPELKEFLLKYRDAVLEIVGYMELPKLYHSLVDQGRICFIPLQPFMRLQYEQAKVDLNIVPLEKNIFTDCKSELKYFESAIVGTITAASPSFSYANAIENGYNGYLCQPGEWFSLFEKRYHETQDYAENRKIQQRIRDCALKKYLCTAQVKRIEEMLGSIAVL